MKKSMIKLGIVALLIVVVAFLALHGLQIGKYVLKPVGSAISLGLDLKGGVSTEYVATDTSMDNYAGLLEGTVGALRTRLTNAGFTEATGRLIGQSISIYLDDELISAPTVQTQISGGSGIITGSKAESTEESVKWANGLAIQIQSGALPMDIAEVETRAISATLGVEAIKGALIAGVIGLILILIFMLVMYRLPGVAADMALLIYVLIVFYALAISGAQLTLQGIAGILLGIGMAVDANVVIFERFREELKEGRTPLNAVKYGFRNAGRAVADSNITTLIAAVVLLIFGTGTIKGFAITLTISVVVSLFTAVVVTRSLLMLICKLGINNRSAYTR